jgi:PAS domain S-box-containing protein
MSSRWLRLAKALSYGALAAVVGLVLLVLREERVQDRSRLQRSAENAAHTLQLHLWGDAELLEALAASLETRAGKPPRGDLARYCGRQPEMQALGVVPIGEGEAVAVPASAVAALGTQRFRDLARDAPPAGHALSALFPCGATTCFALVQPLQRWPVPASLVAVYSLQGVLELLRSKAALPESGVFAVDAAGAVVASLPPHASLPGAPAASAAVSTGELSFSIALAAAGSRSFRGLVSLAVLALALCAGIAGTLLLLARESGARQAAASEATARGSELQSVFSSLGEGVLVFDSNGSIRSSNAAAQRILGFDEGELRGRRLEDWNGLVAHEDGSLFTIETLPPADSLRTGRPHSNVVMGISRPDGTQVWLRVSTQPLQRQWQSKRCGIVLSFSDISEQRVAALELQRKHAMLGFANELLASVARCQAHFIAGEPVRQFFEGLLAAARRLTGSEAGFVAEVLRDEHGAPRLVSRALANLAWDEPALQSLLAAALRSAGVFIANDGRGFAAIPLSRGGDVVGMIVLADRPGGYSASQLAELEPLLATAATIIEAARAQEARQAAEAALRLHEGAFEAAANAIVMTDRHGRVQWVNRAFSELTGYPAEEAVGRTPALLRSGAHSTQFYEELWQTILSGRVWRGEIVNRRKDGSTYAEEMTITPLRERGGEITHFVAIKQDVGWRRESEHRIRESEERLRKLVQSVDAVVWEAVPDPSQASGMRYTFVSERARVLLGYPPERWLEPGFWCEALHSEDRELVPSLCRWLAASRESFELDYRLIAANGASVWVQDSVRVTAGEDGQPARFAGLLVDVTRARELERRLAVAAEQWRTTFDALDSAVVLLTPTGEIERLNLAAQTLVGRDRQTCVGRRPWELTPSGPWLAARDMLAERPGERRTRDAEHRVWDLNLQPVSDLAGKQGLVLTLREATRLVELQESVAQAKTWEAMGTLVAGVAHEVRNPLFAMSVNIDALAVVVKDQADVAELVDALRSERDRMSRLMEDLLHYGRPARVAMLQEHLGRVLDGVLASCDAIAAAHGVQLRRSGDLDGIHVLMNRQRLEEVFANLIENACQHSKRGSVVRIELARHDERWVRCQVRDAGPGFPPDALSRVFEPFFTRRKGGTGLGLAIVQRFVIEHGGRVRADNDTAGGAVVTVDLPVA